MNETPAAVRDVRDVIAAILHIDADRIISPARIVEDLGASSLDMVEMITALEDVFGLAITDSDAASLRTVADVNELMAKKSRQRAAAAAMAHRDDHPPIGQ